MNDTPTWRSPWLVAAWPGMGAVARIAATHLATQLRIPPLEELDTERFHEPTAIHVEHGLVRPMRAPRSVLYGWHDPRGRQDLLLLSSEMQPGADLHRYASALLERPKILGVRRVVTFAALGTQIHPAAEPRVFATATDSSLLQDAVAAGAAVLEDGEISGMNGLLLAVAAEQGLPALGLLGEMPFFAAGMPNPKAAAAVLRVFAAMARIDLDLRVLDEHAQNLAQALLQDQPRGQPAALPERAGDSAPTAANPRLRRRIEALFEIAGADREKALELKALLDEHGLFREYEDRFLDLFRRGS